ncbi:MAG: hypothetical protein KF782_14445 [Labilithrix sp.]|nr:hypothetical protein [Labilithrix sp.]
MLERVTLAVLTSAVAAAVLVACGPTGAPPPAAPRVVEPKACTQEAKLCPDGSAVSRAGPSCEFAPCPEASDAAAPPPESSRACPDDERDCFDERGARTAVLGPGGPDREVPPCPGPTPAAK